MKIFDSEISNLLADQPKWRCTEKDKSSIRKAFPDIASETNLLRSLRTRIKEYALSSRIAPNKCYMADVQSALSPPANIYACRKFKKYRDLSVDNLASRLRLMTLTAKSDAQESNIKIFCELDYRISELPVLWSAIQSLIRYPIQGVFLGAGSFSTVKLGVLLSSTPAELVAVKNFRTPYDFYYEKNIYSEIKKIKTLFCGGLSNPILISDSKIIFPFYPKAFKEKAILDFDISINKNDFLLIESLASMHGCNLVHRDIKPDNIRLDDQGRPVFIDFGLSSLVCENITFGIPLNDIAGNFRYMAPEGIDLFSVRLLEGENLDDLKARDAYALGLVLAEKIFPNECLTSDEVDYSKGLTTEKVLHKMHGARQKFFEKYASSLDFSNRINLLLSIDNLHKLIAGMIHPAPSLRLSTQEAINSVFYKNLISDVV